VTSGAADPVAGGNGQPRAYCPICSAALPEPAIRAPDRLQGTPGEHQVARCLDCGAGVTLPLVGDEQLGAFYPDGYGPYDERMSGLQRVVSRAIRALQASTALRTAPLSALRNRRPGRGLDVGCGRGDLLATLAGRGWEMSGIEPSPSACTAAARRGLDARCGTLSTVALEPGSYDAVVFRHSLEHINDPVAALRLVREALMPGGLVLITVPNFGSWQARRFAGHWFHLDVPRHRVHFTAPALERALAAGGLEPVAVSTSSSTVGLPGSIQYGVFGRCLFPGGLGLRVASGLATLTLPVSLALDRVAGGGDLLHAVAAAPGS
jgi:SAM-dependent methyltransferase